MKTIAVITIVVLVTKVSSLPSLSKDKVEEVVVEVGSNVTLRREGDVKEGCRFNTFHCCYSAKERGDTICPPENQGKFCKKENSFMVEELVTKKIFPNSEMFIGHCVLHLYNVTNNDEGNYIVNGHQADSGEIILKVKEKKAEDKASKEMTTDNEDDNFTEVFPDKVKDDSEIILEVEEKKAEETESKDMTDNLLWPLIIFGVFVIFIVFLTIWKVRKRLLNNERLHDKVEESEDTCSSSVLPWNWKCIEKLVEKILPRTNTKEKDPEEMKTLMENGINVGEKKPDVTCETFVEIQGKEEKLGHGNKEVLEKRKTEKLNLEEEIDMKKNETKTNMEEEKEHIEKLEEDIKGIKKEEDFKKLEEEMERIKKKDEEIERIKKLKGNSDKKYLAKKIRANELKKQQNDREKEKISEQLIEETTEMNNENLIISASLVEDSVPLLDIVPSKDQGPSLDMVSSEDTVSSLNMVPSKDTNPSVDTVPPVDTVPSLDMVPRTNTEGKDPKELNKLIDSDVNVGDKRREVKCETNVEMEGKDGEHESGNIEDIVSKMERLSLVKEAEKNVVKIQMEEERKHNKKDEKTDRIKEQNSNACKKNFAEKKRNPVPSVNSVPSTESTLSSQSPQSSFAFSPSQHELLPVETNKDAAKSRQKKKENILYKKRGISVNQE